MNISDVTSGDGKPQSIYCHNCNNHLDLAYADFDEEISGVQIRIEGLAYNLRSANSVRLSAGTPAGTETYWLLYHQRNVTCASRPNICGMLDGSSSSISTCSEWVATDP